MGIDSNLVDAQEARRALDRVVGYQLSPLLWRRFSAPKLSAGRVQSVALCMVADRFKRAAEFAPERVWTVEGIFAPLGGEPVTAHAHKLGDSRQAAIMDAESAVAMLTTLAEVPAWRAAFRMRTLHQNPQPPFTTSTLQQEALTTLGIGPKRCMALAQGLYEGGLITYMRTDSTHVSREAQDATLRCVRDAFGTEAAKARDFARGTGKHAQEAHEAVRPTDAERGLQALAGGSWTGGHRKLFELIWRRAVASQMAPAEYREVMITITAVESSVDLEFRGAARVLAQEGFLAAYKPEAKARPEELGKWRTLLEMGSAEAVPVSFRAAGDVTRPPALFTEATLIKALEANGVGRPSTFACTLDKLFDRGYVAKGSSPAAAHKVTHYTLTMPAQLREAQEVKSAGGPAGQLVPSPLGARVAEYLESIVPSVVQVQFTARMEEALDAIAHKKTTKESVLGSFYKDFSEVVERAKASLRRPEEGARNPSKNVLKDFPHLGTQVVKTRFGPALFHTERKAFGNLAAFLAWKKKPVEELSDKDVRFLWSLPLTLGGVQVHLGRYGLYARKGAESFSIPRGLWDGLFNNAVDPKDLEAALFRKARRW